MTADAGTTRASRPAGGIAAILTAAVLWGTTGTATHFAPGVPAFVFGAVTFGLGGLVLAATSGRSVVRAVAGRGTRGWVLVGAASLVVYAVAFYAALADAGVALGTTVAIGSSPVFAGLIEWAADGRRVSRRWVLATVVSVLGMVLVTLARAGAHDASGAAGASASGAAGAVDGELLVGLGCALLAGATYASYSWAVARGMHVAAAASLPAGAGRVAPLPGRLMTEHTAGASDVPGARGASGARALVGAVFGLAAVPLLVLAVVGGHEHLGTGANWPVFVYLALVPTLVGHSLYAVGLRTVSASAATLLSLSEPVVAAVLAVVVVGERLGVVGWSGIGLVVAGLAVLAVPTSRR